MLEKDTIMGKDNTDLLQKEYSFWNKAKNNNCKMT